MFAVTLTREFSYNYKVVTFERERHMFSTYGVVSDPKTDNNNNNRNRLYSLLRRLYLDRLDRQSIVC